MKRRKRGPLPAVVGKLASRIKLWRETRTKRSPMPAELWDEATELARAHGPYPISQELHISYADLRKRAEAAGGKPSTAGVVSKGFVEVSPAHLPSGLETKQTEIEMTGTDGAKLVVRLTGGQQLNVEHLVEAFWRRRT